MIINCCSTSYIIIDSAESLRQNITARFLQSVWMTGFMPLVAENHKVNVY